MRPSLYLSSRFLRSPASVMSPSLIMSSTPLTDVGCMILRDASWSWDSLRSWKIGQKEGYTQRCDKCWFYDVGREQQSFCPKTSRRCLPFPHRPPAAVDPMVLLWPWPRWVPRCSSPPKPSPPSEATHHKCDDKRINIKSSLSFKSTVWQFMLFPWKEQLQGIVALDVKTTEWNSKCYLACNILPTKPTLIRLESIWSIFSALPSSASQFATFLLPKKGKSKWPSVPKVSWQPRRTNVTAFD